MMNNNIILDQRYNSFGLSDLRNAISNDIEEIMNNFKGNRGQIAVLKHLPRIGKTYGLLNYLNNTPNICALYASDVIEQIDQISSNFSKVRVIKGAAKVCPLFKDDESLNYLFSSKFKRNIACVLCPQFKGCIYWEQFNYPEKDVILAVAKESLPNQRIHSSFDFIVFDEDMTKSRVIEPYFPKNIPADFLNSLQYGEMVLDLYLELEYLIDEKEVIDEDGLRYFKGESTLLGSNKVLKVTLKEYDQMNSTEKKNFNNVLPFISNLHLSYEWVERCYKIGEYRNRLFTPYIHSAFDLLKEYGCNLIIANATFDEDIFNLLRGQYKTVLPEISSISGFPIENKGSSFFNYNMLGRSCSRTGLDNYGEEIFSIVESISNFCRNNEVKSGLITFPEYEDDFIDSFDVVDHFVAHRGKNDFDDVGLLVILGTYNIPRQAILAHNYAISGEYLNKKQIEEWENDYINGCRVSVPKYAPYRKTKMYKLHEEHLQAILRSGAHTKSGKAVVNFGYAPMDVKDIFTYKTFNSKRQLINGYLTRMSSKKRRKNKKR